MKITLRRLVGLSAIALAWVWLATATATQAQSLTLKQRTDNVFFVKGGSKLDPSAVLQLDALAVLLEDGEMQNTCIKLVGHADSNGKPSINLALSQRRAETVAAYLTARLKVSGRIVEVIGVGADSPLDGLPLSAPEQRRVALFLKLCPST